MTAAIFRRVDDEPPHLVEVHALSLLSNVDDVWWWACYCRAGGSEATEQEAKAAWEAHRG